MSRKQVNMSVISKTAMHECVVDFDMIYSCLPAFAWYRVLLFYVNSKQLLQFFLHLIVFFLWSSLTQSFHQKKIGKHEHYIRNDNTWIHYFCRCVIIIVAEYSCFCLLCVVLFWVQNYCCTFFLHLMVHKVL